MSKKLPMSKVKKEAKKLDEIVVIPFDIYDENEEKRFEYQVQFKPFFSNRNIQNAIKDLRDSLVGFKKYGIELSDELIYPLLSYYVIKNQSDLSTPNKNDYKNEENFYKAEEQFFYALYDTGYIKTITDYFVEEEWSKVVQSTIQVVQADEKIKKQFSQMQESMDNLEINNKELNDVIKKNKSP
ncbi:hypothetical protein [Paraliobacillus ryukyuensis]|uniref:hypothetical protein n=1 Tax=Paraliobacillus ryukyuensis TaxID=200904 RepID=UPI0009A74F99|nr:hypothetical protein [Paraliobacillus ryukyuensis]